MFARPAYRSAQGSERGPELHADEFRLFLAGEIGAFGNLVAIDEAAQGQSRVPRGVICCHPELS